MQPTSILGAMVLVAVCPGPAAGEIHKHGGSAEPLPHHKYVRVVSEADSPVQQVYVKSKDGAYVAAAIRKPKGDGPFPAIIMFHGAPGGRGMEQLVGWSRGDHGGPVWERFLSEGFVVAVADYRGGDWNAVNVPSTAAGATAVDDGLAVIEHVTRLPYVDAARVSLYGVSLGGNLVAFLASKVPTIHAAVLGAPFPAWFLGIEIPAGGPRADLLQAKRDTAVATANISPIRAPVLILAGTADRLLPLATLLHDQLAQAGKAVRMDVYEHGYHDFVLGPQGQKRQDMPQGEVLLQGTLDALELTVAFVKAPDKRSPDMGRPRAREVVAAIQEHVGVPWATETVDTFKAGNPDARVTGIAVTMMATMDVLQRAAAKGLNFVITHEPTFYAHLDTPEGMPESDPVWAEKRAFIAQHGLIVWRFHDHWHRRDPDGIDAGVVRALGWDGYRKADSPSLFVVPETTLKKLAAEVAQKLDSPVVRVVGDPEMKVRNVALRLGAPGAGPEIRALESDEIEVLLVGETREWETVAYVADAATLRKKKALIVIGHIPSEQAGMDECARWLRGFVKNVPVEFVPAEQPFWTVGR